MRVSQQLTCMWFAVAASCMVQGCGGGGGSTGPTDKTATPTGAAPTPTSAPSPTSQPGPSPAPPAPPPPSAPPPPAPQGATVLYFSDCQAGAGTGCIVGNNANPGTQAAPKQNLSGIDINSLAAGSQLLFARGGAWSLGTLRFANPYVTAAAPLIVDAWGQGAAPVLRASSMNAIEFGTGVSSTPNNGGYAFRNVRLDGLNSAEWGIFLRGNVHDVTLESIEISGFRIAIHTQNINGTVVDRLTLRNASIHHNIEMGLLGDANNLLVENSRFEANNFSGSNFNHGIYLGGSGRNVVIRNNVFAYNSALAGVCSGGNLTVHGQWDGMLIEGNTVVQAAAIGTCYGIVLNGGYVSEEWFRNVTVRYNRVVNVGGCGICLNSAPYAVVDSNVIINDLPTYLTGVLLPSGSYEGGDASDVGATVRNNVACYLQPASGSSVTRLTGAGATESNNILQIGVAASTGACAR